MSLNQTAEAIAQQARNTVRNTVNNAASDVRRETSITGWANRMMGKLSHRAAQAGNSRTSRREGVYILPAEAVRQSRQGEEERAFVAPDGYVRRSPVQEIVEDPGYRRRLLLRGIAAGALLLAAATVLYTLLRTGIL